jgi:GT2 family glycosyltransferase
LELGNHICLNATLTSLRAQVYGRWTLHGVVSETTPADVLAAFRREMAADARLHEIGKDAAFGDVISGFAGDDMVAILGFGDGLPDHALAVVVERLFREPGLRIVYGDEDALSTHGVLHSPVFKPDWSPLFFENAPFLGRLTCVRAADLAGLGLGAAGEFIGQETAIVRKLAAAAKPKEIGHIRRILYRRWRDRDVKPLREGPVTVAYVAAASSNDQPEVSIVIPTRDGAALLGPCVESLRKLTDYPRYNIVIVDNGSTEADAVALLRKLSGEPGIHVVENSGPFNFSALCNEGARATASPVIVFLNNDTVIFDKDWLAALVKYAVRPDVGVVGAKLLFPDNRIEHAGVVLGHGGIAGHLYHRHTAAEPGYMGQLRVSHEVAAVTGACIAIERRKFDAVGGFDAENLPVDLNDIDLCLRISEKGWATIWTPESVLYHLQSASRGFQFKPTKVYRKEREFFMKQWPHVVRDDPFFHPALSLYSHKPALA